MTAEQWKHVKDLFERARDLAPAARERLLAQVRKDEPPFYPELVALLASHDSPSHGTLDPPIGAEETLSDALPSTSTLFQPGQLLCSRYRILRYVDRGGMGEVYLADDLDLGATIALKAVRLGITEDETAVLRFKREVDLARRVSHPRVGRIFDFGRHSEPGKPEIPFLTMEYLAGETLAQRLRRAGPLNAAEAWPIIRDIADALDAIHENGIVHRDFKPGNVMLIEQSRLTAKVMDFGVARASDDDHSVTGAGGAPGTPAYMAPEQRAGHAGLPADIYALGVVIHEILTGALPGAGGIDPARSLGDAPLHWTPVVRRCVLEDPAGRFPTAGAAAAALDETQTRDLPTRAHGTRRALWMSLAALALVLIGAVFGWRTIHASPRHVGVLQVRNASGVTEDQALCDGFSDTLRGQLAKLEHPHNALWVIPSSDMRLIKTTSQAFREVAATLVVESTFRRNADVIAFEVDLIDARDQHLLTSEAFEIPLDQMSTLPNRAVSAIARLLDVEVGPSLARQVAASVPREPGAFEFYEQGLGYFSKWGLRNTDAAIALFRKALQKDPRYVLAYAALSVALERKYYLTKDTQFIDEAAADAQTALSLNSALPEVHAALGKVYQRKGQFGPAINELNRALSLDPSLVDSSYALGEIYVDQNKWDDARKIFQGMTARQPGEPKGWAGLAFMYARHGGMDQQTIAALQKVTELRPDSETAFASLGGAYLRLGQYGNALAPLKRSIEIAPTGLNYSILGSALMFLHRYVEAAAAMENAVLKAPHDHDSWRNLGDSYRQIPSRKGEAEGAYRKALAAAEDQLRVNSTDSDVTSSIGLYYAHLGNAKRAVEFTERAIRLAPGDNGVLFTSALSYELVGDRDKAFKMLAAAFKAGYSQALISEEPELADLRKDPRYSKLFL